MMAMAWTLLLRRLRVIRWIVREDSTAFTEWLSGATLLGLRALLLSIAPRDVLPIDVRFRLAPITEQWWASYIMVLGVLQVLLAGSRHSTIRMLVKAGVMFGFTVVATAYWLEGMLYSPGMIGFIGLDVFYFVLFVRILSERKAGKPSLEERLHHAGP